MAEIFTLSVSEYGSDTQISFYYRYVNKMLWCLNNDIKTEKNTESNIFSKNDIL